jgi:hypothetical protein
MEPAVCALCRGDGKADKSVRGDKSTRGDKSVRGDKSLRPDRSVRLGLGGDK